MTPANPSDQPGGRPDPAPALHVRLLGPLELRLDGTPLPLPGGKPRALLAALLVSRNRVVPADSLADAIWDGDVPGNFLATMQVHVSALRRALRPLSDPGLLSVTTQSPGYRIVVDDALVDVGRFGRWARAGNDLLTAHRYAEAADRLRAALAEWAGPALAGPGPVRRGGAAGPTCADSASPTTSPRRSRRSDWSRCRGESKPTLPRAWSPR